MNLSRINRKKNKELDQNPAESTQDFVTKFPKLYRKRIIPDETVYLKDDLILYADDELIITKWEALKPRLDFRYGFSCYYPEQGFKISKVYTNEKKFVYTYCDIISTEKNAGEIIFHDLLIDIVIEPGGFVKVLDLDEISVAYEKNLICVNSLLLALNITDKLLKIIYSGGLSRLTAQLDECIKGNI